MSNHPKTNPGADVETPSLLQAINPNTSDNTRITIIDRLALQTSSRDACLVVIHGSELGKRHLLNQPIITIGRSAKNDIQIDEESISRNHAMIINHGTSYMVRDLGSTNGTYVNDVQIHEQILADNTQIRVGRTVFKFLLGDSIESSYHEEIYRITTQDSLTLVYNKRYLMETFEREFSRALRYGRRLSLLIFDIDRFKSVNDEYGHLTGDFVLKQVAGRLKEQIRRDDVFARYGGEEFVLLLPEISKAEATHIAEKLRRVVASTPFHFDQTEIPVTISIGVADLEEYVLRLPPELRHMDPVEQHARALLKLADDRLLDAKRRGRNCVVIG